ncbi:VOC family protein [Polycladomyces sp. WAk]|uniref:VOC family protein n=1 Tax=Polycladomyces zharkentensis TaxID=2807616 RepID=A0ABS2WG96_9BACL|nr:VOC family protein [Polycladomyces sp. WAk]MBN2908450.1 VOC family protein [Polycladomyces sp. WAk]
MGDQFSNAQIGQIGFFEINAKNPREVKGFYESVFGWKIADDDGESLNISGDEAGINGHIFRWPHEHPPYITFYVKVENIQATLDKVTQAGGKVMMPETEIPGDGTFALFTDPEGHVMGIYSGR